MTYSSCLANDLTPLALDTSVLINLHASTLGERILSALPNEILVSRIVIQELSREARGLTTELSFVKSLISSGKIVEAVMNECELELFRRQISDSPSLDDGEAATIAVSACRRLRPVIDERKGRSRAQVLIPDNEPAWSLDLFRHVQVVASLGEFDAIQGLYLALRNGRMRVHSDHCDQVVSLIGVERALSCISLPNFKARRATWEQKVREGRRTTRVDSNLTTKGHRKT